MLFSICLRRARKKLNFSHNKYIFRVKLFVTACVKCKLMFGVYINKYRAIELAIADDSDDPNIHKKYRIVCMGI